MKQWQVFILNSFLIIYFELKNLKNHIWNKVPSPDLNKFVFFKSLENIRGVLIDDMSSDGRYVYIA